MSLRLYSIRLFLLLDRNWRKTVRGILFWRRHQGTEAFLARYKTEQVVALSESDRARGLEFEKCQACSYCTLSCKAVVEGAAPPSFEPKMLATVFGKNRHETEVFVDAWFPCASCGACTVQCPTDVPLHDLVEQILARRAKVGFRRGTQRF